MNVYNELINTCYDNFDYFLTTKYGYIFTGCVGLVAGFAIGVGLVMKKFMDMKNHFKE